MKKVVLIVMCFLTLLPFGGCKRKQPNPPESRRIGTVTLRSSIAQADVWLLPDTQKNRKTTVWGAASAAGVKAGETRTAALSEPGDNGLYLLRMIDADGFYYEANGLPLQAGWSVEIKGDGLQSMTVEVTDETGERKNTCKLFAAKL